MNVLILSNHHRRAGFFETTMKKLWDSGYKNIWIQETGASSWGSYQGPGEVFELGHKSFDHAMVLLKQRPLPEEITHLLFVDNDCFIEGPEPVEEFLYDFNRGGFDWAAHHVSARETEQYDFSYNSIVECTNQKFLPSGPPYGFAPDPHWENAYLVIKRDLWDNLSPQDVSNTRAWIKAVHDRGAKMGAHKAQYRLYYSHYGVGWFHVGNLMAYYYALESRKFDKFRLDSELDMSRLGYFFNHEERYPNQMPASVRSTLDEFSEQKTVALDAWNRLIAETCLETWLSR